MKVLELVFAQLTPFSRTQCWKPQPADAHLIKELAKARNLHPVLVVVALMAAMAAMVALSKTLRITKKCAKIESPKLIGSILNQSMRVQEAVLVQLALMATNPALELLEEQVVA